MSFKEYLKCWAIKLKKRRLKANEFQCAMCQEVFEKELGWDAEKECEEIFGVKSAGSRDDMVRICDNCWQKVRPYGDGHAP